MRPTEQLMKEHDAIKLTLQVLEKICRTLETGERVNTEHLDQILEFIRVFSDKCHHGKEEDLLFPALERAGIPKQGGPIGVMLREHDIGRGFVKGMSAAIDEYKAGGRGAAARIIQNATNYISLLTEHIEKENTILFPMADRSLSQEEQDALLEQFERVEVEKIGPGRHEEFHALLKHLKEVYLISPRRASSV